MTLAGNSVVDTTNAGDVPDGNDITVGAVIGAAFNLTLNAGTAAERESPAPRCRTWER